MNEALISDFRVVDPPNGWEGAEARTNYFDMYAGAARFGSGRFLLREADYRALEKRTTSSVTTLYLRCRDYGGQQEAQEVEIPVIIAGAQPYSKAVPEASKVPGTANLVAALESLSSGVPPTEENIVEVALLDGRVRTAGFFGKTKHYNCQKFDLGGFHESTLKDGKEWTWEGVFADLGENVLLLGGGGGTISPSELPKWKPRNLSWKGVPVGRILDDLAARLFLVVGFRSRLGRLVLYKPGAMSDTNRRLLTEAITIGASGETLTNALRLPSEIIVQFPVLQDAADDLFSSAAVYEKSVPTGTGLDVLKQHLPMGEYWAVPGGASESSSSGGGNYVNKSQLDGIAEDIARRLLASLKAPIATYEIPGVWGFEPDGAVRAIRWICGPSGALTMVRLNNGREWSPLDEMLRTAREAAYNQTLVTIGEPAVHASAGGVKMLRRSSRVMFDAIIDGSEDSEGAAGDSGKFLYDFTEVGLKSPGEYGDWSGGQNGGTRTGRARNRMEEVGEHEPIPDGTVVVVTEYTTWTDKGEPEKSYWIEASTGGGDGQWATIGGASADGDNKWVYTATLEKDGEEVSGVRNGMELPNSGSGVQGNGVNVDNLPDGFELQPIASGVRVRVWTLKSEEGEDEYWFSAPNGVDGECTSDPNDPTKSVLAAQVFGW